MNFILDVVHGLSPLAQRYLTIHFHLDDNHGKITQILNDVVTHDSDYVKLNGDKHNSPALTCEIKYICPPFVHKLSEQGDGPYVDPALLVSILRYVGSIDGIDIPLSLREGVFSSISRDSSPIEYMRIAQHVFPVRTGEGLLNLGFLVKRNSLSFSFWGTELIEGIAKRQDAHDLADIVFHAIMDSPYKWWKTDAPEDSYFRAFVDAFYPRIWNTKVLLENILQEGAFRHVLLSQFLDATSTTVLSFEDRSLVIDEAFNLLNGAVKQSDGDILFSSLIIFAPNETSRIRRYLEKILFPGESMNSLNFRKYARILTMFSFYDLLEKGYMCLDIQEKEEYAVSALGSIVNFSIASKEPKFSEEFLRDFLSLCFDDPRNILADQCLKTVADLIDTSIFENMRSDLIRMYIESGVRSVEEVLNYIGDRHEYKEIFLPLIKDLYPHMIVENRPGTRHYFDFLWKHDPALKFDRNRIEMSVNWALNNLDRTVAEDIPITVLKESELADSDIEEIALIIVETILRLYSDSSDNELFSNSIAAQACEWVFTNQSRFSFTADNMIHQMAANYYFVSMYPHAFVTYFTSHPLSLNNEEKCRFVSWLMKNSIEDSSALDELRKNASFQNAIKQVESRNRDSWTSS